MMNSLLDVSRYCRCYHCNKPITDFETQECIVTGVIWCSLFCHGERASFEITPEMLRKASRVEPKLTYFFAPKMELGGPDDETTTNEGT